MKAKLTCGRCDNWLQDEIYKEEGMCNLFTNAYTRKHHICQKSTFEYFPNVYYKNLNVDKSRSDSEGKRMLSNMIEVTLKSQLLIHISLGNAHKSKHKLTVQCLGNDVHGLVFFKESKTFKKKDFSYGKTTTVYYWSLTGKEYKTIDDILKTKNLKLKSDEKS